MFCSLNRFAEWNCSPMEANQKESVNPGTVNFVLRSLPESRSEKRSLDLYIKDPSRGNVMQVSFLTRCFSTSVHRIPHASLPNWLQTYVFSAQISPAMISQPSRSLLWLVLLFWTRFRRTRCTMSSNKHIPWKLPFAPSFWTGVYQTV